MSFAFRYRMREHARALSRWAEAKGRIAALVAAAGLMAVVYLVWFVRPFDSRDMTIVYRPGADSVVFNLGHEYRLRTIRLVALDEQGREGATLWRFTVPADAPRLSTFSLPPRDRRAQTAPPPPPLEPGRTYRLKVAAAGARGVADFRLDPALARRPG